MLFTATVGTFTMNQYRYMTKIHTTGDGKQESTIQETKTRVSIKNDIQPLDYTRLHTRESESNSLTLVWLNCKNTRVLAANSHPERHGEVSAVNHE